MKSAPASSTRKSAKGSQSMGREGMLAKIESVRLGQRQAGHFDCFAKAFDGYCDQGACQYRSDCLKLSKRMA